MPDKIRHLETHANTKGDSLIAVVEQMLRDTINTKRSCLSTDYSTMHDEARLEHRPSMSLINYRSNSYGYTMMVFTETYIDEKGEEKEQRRHYSIEENNRLVVTVFRQVGTSGKWVEHVDVDENGVAVPQPTLPNNVPYDYIPIRIAEIKKPALLGMARSVWKGFKISADYFGMMHKFTPTLVIKSDKTAEALQVGFENGVKVGQSDDVELLQPGTDGANPQKEAMEGMFNSAVDQGVRLVSESTKIEAAEALYLRNANKQIKMDSVARIVSKEVEEALRVAAVLEGANPDEVKFKLKVELVESPVDIEQLKEMREAVVDSNLVKWTDYVLQMEANNLITLERKKDGTLDAEKYIKEVIEQNKVLNVAEPEMV